VDDRFRIFNATQQFMVWCSLRFIEKHPFREKKTLTQGEKRTNHPNHASMQRGLTQLNKTLPSSNDGSNENSSIQINLLQGATENAN